MSHYAPHSGVSFEGYYSKFRLASGSSIALIVSAVPAVAHNVSPDQVKRNKAFMISFTYVKPESNRWFQREYWPELFSIDGRGSGDRFAIKWDGGEFGWDGDAERVWWSLETDEVTFSASTRAGSRRPWISGEPSSTPAGWLARLPLPIQWDVHSLDSDCDYTLHVRDTTDFDLADCKGLGKVHTEKNWAYSVPDSYIWVQARDHERNQGVCLAGGSLVPGVQAFLIGYDHPSYAALYRPPESTSIFSLSLGLASDISYRDRRVVVEVRGWFTRIRVTAEAPPDSFFTFAAPLNTGHAPDYATQSFGATVEVDTWKRSWPWLAWVNTSRQTFARGSLEFGGGFYKSHQA